MARAIWSGAITFGLVNVPVRLYSATASHKLSFHQFQKGTGQRIRHKRVAEETGEEVPYEDIVKGYELEKGRYVIVTPEELEAIQPGRSRTIDIEDFVELDEIDPVVWNKTYYLGPAAAAGASKSYELLRRALEDTGRVAVARFVMRTKQYLATIRPLDGLLALETMFFADEIRSADEVEAAPVQGVSVAKRELEMAERLVESLTTAWDHEKYRDTYREAVEALIERKERGEAVVEEAAPEPSPVVDLVGALEASLKAAQAGRGDGGAAKRARGNGGRPEETRAARHRPAGKARGRKQQAGELSGLSKTELYERASEADIPGRSKMSKQELVSALREAGR